MSFVEHRASVQQLILSCIQICNLFIGSAPSLPTHHAEITCKGLVRRRRSLVAARARLTFLLLRREWTCMHGTMTASRFLMVKERWLS